MKLTEYENPPQDASPEKLKKICTHLVEGEATREELKDEVEMGTTLIDASLRYGVLLGFLEEEDGGFSTTKRGTSWHYTDRGTTEANELFRSGIEEYPLFSELITHLISTEIGENGEFRITQSDVIKALRTEFGFTLSENTLKNGANTFLETLDFAGYGDYIIGRGGKPTRLEANESLLKESGRTREVEAQIEQEPETEEKPEGGPPSDVESFDVGVGSSKININLELTGSDDPENVFQLLTGIRWALETPLEELASDEEKDVSYSESLSTQELSDFIEGGNDEQTDE